MVVLSAKALIYLYHMVELYLKALVYLYHVVELDMVELGQYLLVPHIIDVALPCGRA